MYVVGLLLCVCMYGFLSFFDVNKTLHIILKIAVSRLTYHTATDADDEEGLHGSGGSDDPRHSNEEDDAEDVLDAGQIDSHESAQIGLDRRFRVGVGRTLLNGGRVVGQ